MIWSVLVSLMEKYDAGGFASVVYSNPAPEETQNVHFFNHLNSPTKEVELSSLEFRAAELITTQ